MTDAAYWAMMGWICLAGFFSARSDAGRVWMAVGFAVTVMFYGTGTEMP